MCLREITCCDPAIISIMFLHGEDMQPSGIDGKKDVDMIVQMDADECEKAGSFAVLSLSEIKSERIDMQSTQDRQTENAANGLNAARNRRILAQR